MGEKLLFFSSLAGQLGCNHSRRMGSTPQRQHAGPNSKVPITLSHVLSRNSHAHTHAHRRTQAKCNLERKLPVVQRSLISYTRGGNHRITHNPINIQYFPHNIDISQHRRRSQWTPFYNHRNNVKCTLIPASNCKRPILMECVHCCQL